MQDDGQWLSESTKEGVSQAVTTHQQCCYLVLEYTRLIPRSRYVASAAPATRTSRRAEMGTHCTTDQSVNVRVQFEPNRLSDQCLATAYELALPLVRKDRRQRRKSGLRSQFDDSTCKLKVRMANTVVLYAAFHRNNKQKQDTIRSQMPPFGAHESRWFMVPYLKNFNLLDTATVVQNLIRLHWKATRSAFLEQ